MKEPYNKGSASHIGSEPRACVAAQADASMLRNEVVKFVLVVVFLVLNGCGTLQSKIGSYEAPPQLGHVYSGTQLHVEGWRYYTSKSYKTAGIPYRIVTPIWHVIVFAIDFPLTLIADTLILPIDIYVDHDYKRMSYSMCCERLNTNTSKVFRLSQEKIEESWEPYRIRGKGDTHAEGTFRDQLEVADESQ